jgi:biotin transporter BioY
VFDAIAIGDPAAANLSVSHTSPTFGVIDGLVLAALWLWMAWKTGTGRNWARVASTVFFGLLSVYCGKFVFELFSVTTMKAVTAGYLGAFFLQWIVGLVALILLWQYPSSCRWLGAGSYCPGPGDGLLSPPSHASPTE